MAASPITKSIADYLWEWASARGVWARLLVTKIIENDDYLDADELEEVYDLFLNDIGVKKLENIPDLKKPSYESEATSLKLLSMRDIVGVNRLAEEEPLEFGNNITVLYGGNGTGKTGYARILKSVGFSYEDPRPILADVFDEDPDEQSATITYELDGEEDSFDWTPENQSDDLKDISVFSNDCVRISIEARRPMIVSPIGFDLFAILTTGLGKLEDLNDKKILTYDTNLDWESDLHEETEAEEFISELTASSKLSTLKKLAEFSDEHEKKLTRAMSRLSKLNRSLLETQIRSLRFQANELDRVIATIKDDKRLFSRGALKALVTKLTELRKLKRAKRQSLSEIAKKKGVELYDSDAFEEFIEAAEQYLEAIEDDDYPEYKDAVCIYCQQSLSKEAAKLLASYRRILCDDTQERIAAMEDNVTTTISKVLNATDDHYLHQPSFGQDEDDDPVQPPSLTRYNSRVASFKKVIKTKDIMKLKAAEPKIPFARTVGTLSKKADKIREIIQEKTEQLDNMEQREAKLRAKIRGLQDRKLLSGHLVEIIFVIKKLKIIAKLQSNASKFNTTSVSRQTTKARKELIADEFKEAFFREYKAFRTSGINIDLDFRTDKGESTLLQDIGNGNKLGDVLSEGEQKAIALAEFLAELQLDNVKAPVVFDDPVTSLDHYIIDAVARRLVKLSRKRQVIVFTHSILMFNSIRQRNDSPSFSDIQFRYYQVSRDEDATGYLERNPSPKEETFKHYKTELNRILNLPKAERVSSMTELAIKGYGLLRSGIEAFVERDMLRGVVKRYARNVALTSLERVDGALIEKHKDELNEVYERCCQFVEAHTNPDEVMDDPNLALLKEDFDRVQNIRSCFV